MSLRELRDGRGLMLRLVLAEVLAKRGEGPLAPRFGPLLGPFAKSDASAATSVARRARGLRAQRGDDP